MALFERTTPTGDVAIHHTVTGEGFPVLLLAPGGMSSTLSAWAGTPWNPIEHLSDRYRVVAMDQRNAGRSTGPVTADDGWHTMVGDQLALMDHLGADRFHVAGMCIGGFLHRRADQDRTRPDRVRPSSSRRSGSTTTVTSSSTCTTGGPPGCGPNDPTSAKTTGPGSATSCGVATRCSSTATEDELAAMTTPMLVLMGNDVYHPESTSRILAAAAPNAELIESWKEGPDRDAAMARTADFLAANTP